VTFCSDKKLPKNAPPRFIPGQFLKDFSLAASQLKRGTFLLLKRKVPKRKQPDQRIHPALRRFSLSVARRYIRVPRATSAIHCASLRAHGQSVAMLGCAETGNNNRRIGNTPDKSL
jgi:hypothetical protein